MQIVFTETLRVRCRRKQFCVVSELKLAEVMLFHFNSVIDFQTSIRAYCKTWTGLDWTGLPGFVKHEFVKGGFVKHGFVKGGFVKHGFVKGGFVKHGFVKGGFVKRGFVKHGFVKHGFVKGGFVKHGFVKTGFVKHEFVKG